MTATPYARINLGHDTSGRPLIVNARTRDMLTAANKKLGFALVVIQGSYRAGHGASESAGTHDGGGAVDVRCAWGLPANTSAAKIVRVLREVGFAAWHRTENQGFDEQHIHCVAIGDHDLSPAAARQVTAYRARRNGLANNGLDDGPRVTIVTWEQLVEAATRPPGKPPTLWAHGPKRSAWTKVAQHHLGIRADGIFDARTRVAVIAYRRKHKLHPWTGPSRGVIGARMWRLLLKKK